MSEKTVVQLPASLHRSLAEIIEPFEIAIDNYEGLLTSELMMYMPRDSLSKHLASAIKFKDAMIKLQEKLCLDVEKSADESATMLLVMGRGVNAAAQELGEKKINSLQAIKGAFGEMIKKMSAVIDKAEKRVKKSA